MASLPASLTLAVDTSQSRGQLLLFKDQNTFFESTWEKAKSHSEKITTAFTEVLDRSQFKITDIQKVACVVGPGSFTGIRVGVNFSKALAYSLEAKMVAVNALDLLALNGFGKQRAILSAIDAQKNSVFLSTYSKNCEPIKTDQVVPIAKLSSFVDRDYLVCGSGIESYKSFIDPSVLKNLHLEEQLYSLDLKKVFLNTSLVDLNNVMPWDQLNPLYIKASAPEEKLKPTGL